MRPGALLNHVRFHSLVEISCILGIQRKSERYRYEHLNSHNCCTGHLYLYLYLYKLSLFMTNIYINFAYSNIDIGILVDIFTTYISPQVDTPPPRRVHRGVAMAHIETRPSETWDTFTRSTV